MTLTLTLISISLSSKKSSKNYPGYEIIFIVILSIVFAVTALCLSVDTIAENLYHIKDTTTDRNRCISDFIVSAILNQIMQSESKMTVKYI